MLILTNRFRIKIFYEDKIITKKFQNKFNLFLKLNDLLNLTNLIKFNYIIKYDAQSY